MKKEFLIKKIAAEFNVDEIKVSEYFDSIFETLAVTFIKNKNVNINEFGRFKVKEKSDDEGTKQKTVLFSPVKKFASEINYNFSELSPVQIRVLDKKDIKSETTENIYTEDEVEDIILIDFEDENIPEIKKKIVEEKETIEEILIHEAKIHDIPLQEQKKEEILIPEEQVHDIPLQEQKKEKILIPEEQIREIPLQEPKFKEEILIPEETVREIPAETIPEEIQKEIKEIIQSIKIPSAESTIVEKIEIPESLTTERSRILTELGKISLPEISFPDFKTIIELREKKSKDKRAAVEITSVIKQEEIISDTPEIIKQEEIISVTPEIIKEEEIIPDTPEIIKEEEIISDTPEIIKQEEIISVTPEIIKEEEIIPDTPEIIKEEEIIPVTPEIIEEEEIISEDTLVFLPEEEKEKPDIPKTSLELETELLKMLEERKKILEELKRLENAEEDDLVDLAGPKTNGDEDKPKLFDENTLDRPSQNIFVDEEGMILEDLFKKMIGGEEEKTSKEEEIISGESKESDTIIPESKDSKEEKIIKDTEEEINGESIIKDFDKKEKEESTEFKPDTEINDLENMLNSLYTEQAGENPPIQESEEVSHPGNLEMQVFDKLLKEPEKPVEETPLSSEKSTAEQDLKSFSDLEKMFINFKTEKTETEDILKEEKESRVEKEVRKEEEPKIPVESEAIKTYDDIFNLLEPNGKKKEEKPKEVTEEPKRKISPLMKIVFYLGIVTVIIIVFILIYSKFVYHSAEETKQIPITTPIDSTKVSKNDSVIFADTNKTKETIEEDVVSDENNYIIKESEKGFFVEYGNFENQFELAKKIKELKEKNIQPGFKEDNIEGKQIYKIKLGPFKSLKEAKAIIKKL